MEFFASFPAYGDFVGNTTLFLSPWLSKSQYPGANGCRRRLGFKDV